MILGITPARGGSKGIPRKNLREVSGKPLIAWTIGAARESKLLDRYVVSTEDEEIARVAREYGAEVLERPANLATDDASPLGVLQHAIKEIPCSTIVVLQATCPVRRKGLIDESIKEFFENDCDSLATGFICKYVEYAKNDLRRQDIKGFFYDDGNVYIIRTDLVKNGDRYGKKIGRKIISSWENVDIDDEFDLWQAEQILSTGAHIKDLLGERSI